MFHCMFSLEITKSTVINACCRVYSEVISFGKICFTVYSLDEDNCWNRRTPIGVHAYQLQNSDVIFSKKYVSLYKFGNWQKHDLIVSLLPSTQWTSILVKYVSLCICNIVCLFLHVTGHFRYHHLLGGYS